VGRRDKLIQSVLRERFIFTLRSGASFDGLLVEADEKSFRIANASAVDGSKPSQPVDGELFLPRDEVIYMQKPGVSA